MPCQVNNLILESIVGLPVGLSDCFHVSGQVKASQTAGPGMTQHLTLESSYQCHDKLLSSVRPALLAGRSVRYKMTHSGSLSVG